MEAIKVKEKYHFEPLLYGIISFFIPVLGFFVAIGGIISYIKAKKEIATNKGNSSMLVNFGLVVIILGIIYQLLPILAILTVRKLLTG
ncbi:hypothetical protein [Viridibacillus arvi]|uniref:DUF4190 domain-containing protein n=1 Tax=Viridibacillus arvi TaxID=263475 RepID=A0A0M0LJE7_9BACL|nr:hypothetical protein [Viridibacillus arvi]KOO51017.1 hypothetical protein AMD00_00415 [Viridibacillus arvi]